jgi:hypothetical protein
MVVEKEQEKVEEEREEVERVVEVEDAVKLL